MTTIAGIIAALLATQCSVPAALGPPEPVAALVAAPVDPTDRPLGSKEPGSDPAPTLAPREKGPRFVVLGDVSDLHRMGDDLAASSCARWLETEIFRVEPAGLRAFTELQSGLDRLEKRHPSGTSRNCFGVIAGASFDDLWVSYVSSGKYGDSVYPEVEHIVGARAVATTRLPGPLRLAAPWKATRMLVAVGEHTGPAGLGAELPAESVRLFDLDGRGHVSVAPLQLERSCTGSRLVDIRGMAVGSRGEVVLSGSSCRSGEVAIERFEADGKEHVFTTLPIKGVARVFDLAGKPAVAVQTEVSDDDGTASSARGELLLWDGSSWSAAELPAHRGVLAAAQALRGDLWVIIDPPSGEREVYRRHVAWERVDVPWRGDLEKLEIVAAGGDSYDIYLSSNSSLARAHVP